MDLFGSVSTLDLSDEGLRERLGSQEDQAPAAEEGSVGCALPTEAAENPEAPDPEARWQAAQLWVGRLWPQALGDMEQLVRKMGEISANYGDSALWQRDPEGMLSQAAMALYGPPDVQLDQVVRAALAAGQREEAYLEQERQRRLTLAPSTLRHGTPAPLSPEQEIIQEIAAARKQGIF